MRKTVEIPIVLLLMMVLIELVMVTALLRLRSDVVRLSEALEEAVSVESR